MSEKICGIYKITNLINGKVYIGQSIDIKRRWQDHRNKKYWRKRDYVLYRAFYKYGIENFSFEVLECCGMSDLDEREIFYIQKYNSFYKGYNMTTGGQGVVYPYTEEYRIKRSRVAGGESIIQLTLDGQYIHEYFSIAEAEEVLSIPHENIIKVLNGQYKSAGNFVFVRKSIYNSEKDYSCKREKDIRPIKQYDLSGSFVREYPNQLVASKATGISNVTISATCLHKRKTAGGYQWAFVGDEEKITRVTSHAKMVVKYDKAGNFIERYKTIKEASMVNHIDDGSIVKCCKGKQKTAGGFIWRYSKEGE